MTGPDGKRATYGELAAQAARQSVPRSPVLKNDADLKLIGKPVPRKDTPPKVDGSARFAIDVRLPVMVYAVVRTSPVFGGDVEEFASSSKPPAGTLAVERVPNGFAVVAGDWWTASTAADALKIKFTKTPDDGVSSEEISKGLRKAIEGPAAPVTSVGDADRALASAAKTVQVEYELPFLAHATMEPMSCVADVRPDACEVWVGIQAPEMARDAAAQLCGLSPEKVTIHTTFLGGGFGRRFERDVLTQAVTLSKDLGKPVKVVWTREEDLQHDFYRPAFLCRFTGGLDTSGRPVAWRNRIVCPSIMARVSPGRSEGAVEQSSFDDYPILGMADSPVVEVHLVSSEQPPTGVGEPGVPPAAPALANAIFAATGKPVRKLPIGKR